MREQFQPDFSVTAPEPGAVMAFPGLHGIEFRAMGCGFEMWVATGDTGQAAEALRRARAFVDSAEDVMSRFRPYSELSRLNARAGQATEVSPLLFEVISAALRAARSTGGLYDPTVLPALLRAGYDRSFDTMPRAQQGPADADPGPRGRWSEVQLDPQRRTVRLPRGTAIDLGGVGKAWTAEQAAAILAEAGPCIVSAGGDISAKGNPSPGEGWQVGVEDPLHPGSHIITLEVTDCGVATSGVDYRRWTKNGAPQHHIIDPRTGRPADTDLLSVSVLAADVLIAEQDALAAMLLGLRDGLAFLEAQPGAEGVLACADGRVAFTSGVESYRAPTPGAAT
jgi:thiamine biosynthesis lipoprotein